MKRTHILAIALTLILTSMFIFTVNAATLTPTDAILSKHALSTDNIEIIYSGMSSEKAEWLISNFADDMIIVEPSEEIMSLFCAMFGHILNTGTVTTTFHRQYSYNPRCLRITQFVEYCTRSGCNHFHVTRETRIRISCCL
jgi:hypothetical protein